MGDPLTAPKRPETTTKPTDFPLSTQRRTGAEKIGGSTPNLQSDGLYSPTKLTNKTSWIQLLSSLNKHMIIFSLSLFAFSTFPLPPYFFIFPHLSLFPVFFSFLFPSIPFFFSEIYSPTPFTVRRQGGPLDPPDPPSRTPLDLTNRVFLAQFRLDFMVLQSRPW